MLKVSFEMEKPIRPPIRKYFLIKLKKSKKFTNSIATPEKHEQEENINLKELEDIIEINFSNTYFPIGEVKCHGLPKEKYDISINEIQPYDDFFTDSLLTEAKRKKGKKDDHHLTDIYCVLQFSDYNFFHIPFRINNKPDFLFNNYVKEINLYYFPIRIKFRFPIEKENFCLDIKKIIEHKDRKNEDLYKFLKRVIRIVIWKSLSEKGEKYSSLLQLFGRKWSPLTFIGLIIIAILTSNVYSWLPTHFLKSGGIIPKIVSSIFLFLAVYFFIPILNVSGKKTEGLMSKIYDAEFRSWDFVGSTILLEFSDFQGRVEKEKKKELSEIIFNHMRLKSTIIIITLSLISLVIGLLLKE